MLLSFKFTTIIIYILVDIRNINIFNVYYHRFLHSYGFVGSRTSFVAKLLQLLVRYLKVITCC